MDDYCRLPPTARRRFNLSLDTAENACRRYSRHASHTQYRDGLIIALLAARPIRLKNLTAIIIRRHLRSAIRRAPLDWQETLAGS